MTGIFNHIKKMFGLSFELYSDAGNFGQYADHLTMQIMRVYHFFNIFLGLVTSVTGFVLVGFATEFVAFLVVLGFGMSLASGLVTLLLLDRVGLQRHWKPIVVCLMSAMYFCGGYAGSLTGGVDSVGFMNIYLVPFITTTMLFTWWVRLAITALFSLCYCAGFFIFQPELLGQPTTMLSLTYVGLLVIFASVAGVLFHTVVQRHFESRVQLIQSRAALANQVSFQESRLQQLATALYETEDRERARISHEIHDEFGQHITGMDLLLSWLDGRPILDQDVKAQIGRLRGLVDQQKKSVHRVINTLNLEDLQEGTFVEICQHLVSKTAERYQLDYSIEIDATIDNLDSSVLFQLYRILQEAVTNSLKHAQGLCSISLSISCDKQDQLWTMVYCDRGDPTVAGAHCGSRSIRSRARLINAQVSNCFEESGYRICLQFVPMNQNELSPTLS